jgi:hypothetical protein
MGKRDEVKNVTKLNATLKKNIGLKIHLINHQNVNKQFYFYDYLKKIAKFHLNII